ncbi:hypothetical protein JCM10914_6413 [Paenibacillus sp. JCM 10914]|nr:hypothetical protein JCM10914_6413 [Paenibacillus sp. JCM 10914]
MPARLHIHHLKIDGVLIHIHLRYANLHIIANAVYLRCPLPNKRHMALIEMIIIIGHRAQANQALNGILQLNEHAEAGHAADDAFEFLADLIQHEFGFLQRLGIPLRIHSHTLPLGRLLRNVSHSARQVLMPLLIQRTAALQDLPDHAVNDQIRITPNRRREVGIILRRQAEVTGALRIVLGLLHRSKHHRAKNRLLLRPLNRFQQILECSRMNGVAPSLHMVTEIRGKRHEVLQLLLIRVFMDPVDERHLHPVEMFSHGLVGRQHEFLNNLLRDGAFSFDNIHRLPVIIHNDFGLHKIKVHRSAPHPAVAQLQCQFLH